MDFYFYMTLIPKNKSLEALIKVYLYMIIKKKKTNREKQPVNCIQVRKSSSLILTISVFNESGISESS